MPNPSDIGEFEAEFIPANPEEVAAFHASATKLLEYGLRDVKPEGYKVQVKDDPHVSEVRWSSHDASLTIRKDKYDDSITLTERSPHARDAGGTTMEEREAFLPATETGQTASMTHKLTRPGSWDKEVATGALDKPDIDGFRERSVDYLTELSVKAEQEASRHRRLGRFTIGRKR